MALYNKTITKVIPTIAASKQALGAFADEDILFDWHEVKNFRGTEINGITAIIRGTNGADQTMQDFDLLFATSGIKVSSERKVCLRCRQDFVRQEVWKSQYLDHLLYVGARSLQEYLQTFCHL